MCDWQIEVERMLSWNNDEYEMDGTSIITDYKRIKYFFNITPIIK